MFNCQFNLNIRLILALPNSEIRFVTQMKNEIFHNLSCCGSVLLDSVAYAKGITTNQIEHNWPVNVETCTVSN